MISFNCACGHYKFSLPDDMAGGMIQCPKCRRLNDVPTSLDLTQIDEDGAYKLYDEPEATSTEAVRKMSRAFTRDHHDTGGSEIDLRNADQDFSRIGVGTERIAVNDDAIPIDDPKYDPMTGELIRPVTVKAVDDRGRPKIDPDAVPIGSKAASKIALAEKIPEAADAWLIPFKLLAPINLLVLSLIFIGHVICQALLVLVGFGFLMVALLFPVIQAMFISHFANVIDEIGPTRNDELPAPLRSLSWSDDTGGPLLRSLLALSICFFPAFFAALQDELPGALRWPMAGILAIAGSLFVPATLLTANTSGTYVNLRPDRIWSVITRSGSEYFLPLVLWLIAGPLYVIGTYVLYIKTLGWAIGMFFSGMDLPESFQMIIALSKSVSIGNGPPWVSWTLAYVALAAGIVGLHWMSWTLGLVYRRHHEQFAWLYQRHERDARQRAMEGLPPPPRGFAVQTAGAPVHTPVAAEHAPTKGTGPVKVVAQPASVSEPLDALADAARAVRRAKRQ